MSFKKSLLDQFARIAKALSSANRLEILEFLAQCDYSVEDLAALCDLSIANTSHHLQRLRQAGLVRNRKEGTRVFYSLNGARVTALLGSLREVAEGNLEEVQRLIDTYLTRKDSLDTMTREELLRHVEQGAVTVLDVRPPREFAAGHVPGAINVPLDILETYLENLEPGQQIVAYCRGPYCVLAFDAVGLLRRGGFKAKRMQDGFPEWKSAGLPIET